MRHLRIMSLASLADRWHGARSRVTVLCYCIVSVYRVVPSGVFVGRATRALRLVGMLRLLAMMIVGIVQ